jgi:hypothetical protein
VPLAEVAARIARAVTPTVTRYAAENIAIPLETEPSSFLVVQHSADAADERSAEMNLKDLAAAIRRRKVSSVEVTKALLARIDNGSRRSTPSRASRPRMR